VFGRAGSAEALGDTELVIRRSDQPMQQLRFSRVSLANHSVRFL
jgi:hypothetical protein